MVIGCEGLENIVGKKEKMLVTWGFYKYFCSGTLTLYSIDTHFDAYTLDSF